MGRFRMAVAAALVAAVAAGCGGGGGSKEPAAPTSVAPPGSGPEPSFTGEGSEPFCSEVATFDARFAELLASDDPDAARTLFTSAEEAVASLAGSAPGEIRGDLTVIADAYRELLEGLRAAEFDLSRLSPEVAGSLDTPAVRTAADRLAAYQRTVCGQSG